MATPRKIVTPTKAASAIKKTSKLPEFAEGDIVTLTIAGIVDEVYSQQGRSMGDEIFDYRMTCHNTNEEYHWSSDSPNVIAVLLEKGRVYDPGTVIMDDNGDVFQMEDDGYWKGMEGIYDSPVRPFTEMVKKV